MCTDFILFVKLKDPDNILNTVDKIPISKAVRFFVLIVNFGLMNNFHTARYHKTNNFKTVLTRELKLKYNTF